MKKNLRNTFALLTLTTIISFAAHAGTSTTVDANVNLAQQGYISASWTPSGQISTDLKAGTEIGRLDLTFSGAMALKAKSSNISSVTNTFEWKPAGGVGNSFFVKPYDTKTSSMLTVDNTGTMIVVGNYVGTNGDVSALTANVAFKATNDATLTAGKYKQSFVIDLYSI